ncbi:MAG: helix-turn-helix domain-containing protein [Desulfuromonas sp.]|nr:helix-turn-helix domain-containing protein [Desulfuromonas sp.]
MEPENILKTEATLQIDGSAIKSIREQQSLTQLYVAKMVGVTTDTISRWENNRYPTIKRLNAERLAEALEVELEQIVRPPESVTDESIVAQPRRFRWWLWSGFVLVVLLMTTLWWWNRPQVVAERLLPSYAAPGAVFPVRLQFSGSAVRGVVREQLPEGWRLVAALPKPDSVDDASGLIRWIVQLEDQPLHIYYLVQAAADAPLNQMTRFRGELVAHSASQRVKAELIGADRLVIQHIHWADLNADQMIDDDEMLDASYLSENMPDLPLDLDAVEQLWIEEHYYWDDADQHFVPGWLPQPIQE